MGYYSSSDSSSYDDDDDDNAFSIDDVRQIALGRGYRQCQHEPREGVLDFRRADSDGDSEIVRVWYRTGTVGTYIKHPTQQRTQLFRRDNTQRSQLGEFIFTFVWAISTDVVFCADAIFDNPRVHTGRGYHTRGDRHSPYHRRGDRNTPCPSCGRMHRGTS